MIRIGLTGGIGSGKSTVAHVFSMLGVPVYYSDFHAKQILAHDAKVIEKITEIFGAGAYVNGIPDRRYIAEIAFSDSEYLEKLNNVVHPAVRIHYAKWAEANKNFRYTIMESAILFESGFDSETDRTIVVTAPQSIRIERTIERDGTSRDNVLARMSTQMDEQQRTGLADYILYADEKQLLIPQIIKLAEILETI